MQKQEDNAPMKFMLFNSIRDKACIICVMQCETHKCFEGPLINKLHFAFNICDQINTDGWNAFFCFLNFNIFGRLINGPKRLMNVKLNQWTHALSARNFLWVGQGNLKGCRQGGPAWPTNLCAINVLPNNGAFDNELLACYLNVDPSPPFPPHIHLMSFT